MKINIELDEKWPVFTLVQRDESELKKERGFLADEELVEIPDELASDFLRIQSEYLIMQAQVKEIYDRVQQENGSEAAQDSLRDYLLEDPSRVHEVSQHCKTNAAS